MDWRADSNETNPNTLEVDRLPRAGGRLEVAIFSKKGCHLCEAVEAQMRLTRVVGMGLTVVNIDEDTALHERFRLRVPVVRVEGEYVFKPR